MHAHNKANKCIQIQASHPNSNLKILHHHSLQVRQSGKIIQKIETVRLAYSKQSYYYICVHRSIDFKLEFRDTYNMTDCSLYVGRK